MLVLILFLIIIIVTIFGAPLFSIIGASSMVNFLKTNILIVPQEISGIANTPLLHSIPLFTFAGYILAHSNASKRLVRFTNAALGWLPGGLAIVTLLTCAFFTSFTGASGVTIVALGGLLLPALISEKYNEKFSLGLVTTSGSVGLLFPPSLPIILFGVIAATSIDKLFVAGILPGIIILLVLALYSMYMASFKFKIETIKFSFKEFALALKDMLWELPLPILLFGGIYSGKMAISDTAAFTVLYVLVVEVFIKKDIKIKEIPKIMKESMVLVGAILVILAVSLAATNYMIYQEVPQKLFNLLKNIIASKFLFLLALNIFLLIVGCLMDIFSALVIVVPLILPLAEAYNIDPVHLGIIFLANLEIGYLTPPVGMNLFISSIRFEKSIIEIYRSVVVFILLRFVTLAIITYIPFLSLWFIESPSIVGEWEYIHKDGKIEKIILKSNGKCLKIKGDPMEILFNEPVLARYEINKDKLMIYENENKEEYFFEIYNQGKRLLLKDGNSERFFINKVSPPLGLKAGKIIGKWAFDENNYFEFLLNNELIIFNGGVEKRYRYKVINNKIIYLYEKKEDGYDDKKIIVTYTINNDVMTISGKSYKIVDSTLY